MRLITSELVPEKDEQNKIIREAIKSSIVVRRFCLSLAPMSFFSTERTKEFIYFLMQKMMIYEGEGIDMSR